MIERREPFHKWRCGCGSAWLCGYFEIANNFMFVVLLNSNKIWYISIALRWIQLWKNWSVNCWLDFEVHSMVLFYSNKNAIRIFRRHIFLSTKTISHWKLKLIFTNRMIRTTSNKRHARNISNMSSWLLSMHCHRSCNGRANYHSCGNWLCQQHDKVAHKIYHSVCKYYSCCSRWCCVQSSCNIPFSASMSTSFSIIFDIRIFGVRWLGVCVYVATRIM